jgi:hypothetical protein
MKTGILVASAAALAICIVPSLAADSGAPEARHVGSARSLPDSRGVDGRARQDQGRRPTRSRATRARSARAPKAMLKALSAISEAKQGSRPASPSTPRSRATKTCASPRIRSARQSAQALGNDGRRKDRLAESGSHRYRFEEGSGLRGAIAGVEEAFRILQLDNALRYAPHTLSVHRARACWRRWAISSTQPDAIYSAARQRRTAAARA